MPVPNNQLVGTTNARLHQLGCIPSNSTTIMIWNNTELWAKEQKPKIYKKAGTIFMHSTKFVLSIFGCPNEILLRKLKKEMFIYLFTRQKYF